MGNVNHNSAAQAVAHSHPPSPRHNIVAAVERAETDGIVTALGDAGFARARILEQDSAHAILRECGGHAMRCLGPWTITTLEGDAH